ncbi:hypothetical protein MNAN1_000337 [Malassezia nana]|uniref:Uncharacterized protein n=1 Tax=Malassezia nana TaxID=180528 RepID=A0AAF0J0U3_9BASI|nr:hypothetical protein MNAN1_000337 [Malassezia nana]
MADAERFWAAAYLAPLRDTLAQWYAACAAPRRFVQALREWWPILSDGTQVALDTTPAPTVRPRCVAPWGEEAWLAQRAVLLYLCHAPYCAQHAPPDTQPFRPLVETYAACVTPSDTPHTLDAWLVHTSPHDKAFLLEITRALLAGTLDDVSDVSPCAARHAWAVRTYVPSATPVAAHAASRAAELLGQAGTMPLDLSQQSFLQKYWQRMRHDLRTGQDDSVALMAGLALRDTPVHGQCLVPRLLAPLAQQNASLAAQWVVCTCRLPPTHLSFSWVCQGLWEQVGEALAHDTGSLRAAGDMLVLLLASDECVSTRMNDHGADLELRIAWLTQRVCVPRFLAVLATLVESAWREDVAEFLCTWTLRLVRKGYLPLPNEEHRRASLGRGENDDTNAVLAALEAKADEQLDMLDAVLRSAALRYARHAYAAALYQALLGAPTGS